MTIGQMMQLQDAASVRLREQKIDSYSGNRAPAGCSISFLWQRHRSSCPVAVWRDSYRQRR